MPHAGKNIFYAFSNEKFRTKRIPYMILSITNNYYPNISNRNFLVNNRNLNNQKTTDFAKLNYPCDSVYFTGKSLPSMYSSVFEYLSAEVLASQKKYRVDGSMLSATNIGAAVKKLVASDKFWDDYKKSQVDKIKWKSYIPQDIREFSIDKINQARDARLTQWRDFLKNPEIASEPGKVRDTQLVSKIKSDDSLKFVIWNSVTGEIKDNNRHIPVPFNEKALLETINGFEIINPKDRAVRCAAPSFLEIYTHRLRDNLLMDLNLSDKDSVWVKIPSIKHEPKNQDLNIAKLETLSCKNWCTRSSVDKAKDALLDGDFYIYLERGKFNLWEPLVGMTTSKGQIDQIQGIENNNIVPLGLVDKIKSYISKNNLKCRSGIEDEGPKASQAIMISEKLNEVSDVSKKSFAKAIKEKDSEAMFGFLGQKVQQLDEGLLSIDSYKPTYTINHNSGISIPYSMFGLDENDLLRNVKVINGNLILDNKNPLFSSRITEFPPNLETVTGRIVCSKAQYQKFADDINRIAGNIPGKVIVHSN